MDTYTYSGTIVSAFRSCE